MAMRRIKKGVTLGDLGQIATKRLSDRAPIALQRVADHLEDRLKDNLDQPGTGRVYQKPGGGFHRASAPGEFPAKDRGILQDSAEAHVVPERLAVHVGTPLDVGLYLEEGTINMEPRPFVRRTVMDNAKQIEEILVRELKGNA